MATVAVTADPVLNTAVAALPTNTITLTTTTTTTTTNGGTNHHLVIPTPADEDRFIQLLKELAFSGAEPVFHSKSKWQDLCKIDSFKNDARFKPFECAKFEQIAHDQFEKFCWNMSDQLTQPKQRLKQILKASNYTISPDDTVTHLMTVFSETLRTQPIAESAHLRLLFAEMIAKQQYLSTKRQMDIHKAYPHRDHRHRTDRNRDRESNDKRVKLSSFEDDTRTRTRRDTRSRMTYDNNRDRRDRDNRDRERDNRDRERDNRRRDRDTKGGRSRSPHSSKKKDGTSATGGPKSYPTLPPPFPPPQAYLEMMHRHHENLKKHIERDRTTRKNGYRSRSHSRGRMDRDRDRGRDRYYRRDRDRRERRREGYHARNGRGNRDNRRNDRMHMRDRRNDRDRRNGDNRRYTKRNGSPIKKDFEI